MISRSGLCKAFFRRVMLLVDAFDKVDELRDRLSEGSGARTCSTCGTSPTSSLGLDLVALDLALLFDFETIPVGFRAGIRPVYHSRLSLELFLLFLGLKPASGWPSGYLRTECKYGLCTCSEPLKECRLGSHAASGLSLTRRRRTRCSSGLDI